MRNILFFLFEGLLIFLAVSLVYGIFSLAGPSADDVVANGLRIALITLTFQLAFYFFDLYDLSRLPTFFDAATRITQAFGVSCILLAVVYYFVPAVMISNQVFWVGCLAVCIAISISRFCYMYILSHRLFYERIVIMGSGHLALAIADEIENKKDSGYRISAFVTEDEPGFNHRQTPVHNEMQQILDICMRNRAGKIILALDDRRKKMPIRELMDCKLSGVKIITGIRFYEELTGRVLVEEMNPSWIIFSEKFSQGKFARAMKRLADIAFSSLGLFLSSPITLMCAAAIKIDSQGPIFYSQDRVGEYGAIFTVYKFRSMCTEAEANGPVWAMQNDSRITRVGSFIRKVRIDELPQLWTVLKGDMSFVGPRPERPVFVAELQKKIPYYSLRHNLKPGLTGWAQINYPYGSSEEDALRKLEYDLYYLKNRTLYMDLWIIFQTVKTVLLQKGAV